MPFSIMYPFDQSVRAVGSTRGSHLASCFVQVGRLIGEESHDGSELSVVSRRRLMFEWALIPTAKVEWIACLRGERVPDTQVLPC